MTTPPSEPNSQDRLPSSNMTTGVNNAAAPASGAQSQRQRHDQGWCVSHNVDVNPLTPAESWIEVSSHPSSSSVSSIGDEIVTTGLRVGASSYTRRRRLHPQSYAHLIAQQQQRQFAAHLAGASSQEEYEESETDSDHMLTSSTENIISVPSPNTTSLRRVSVIRHDDTSDDEEEEEEEDDDDHATALGTRRPSDSFHPQPNAFSHPPSHLQHRHSASSAIPAHHPRPSFGQRSNTRIERRSSDNFQADNDEALRSSLTTLLSCAAAARGRNKDEKKIASEQTSSAGGQPVNLRLVPESELMDPTTPRPVAAGRVLRADPAPSPPAPTRTSAAATPEKVKRSATPTPQTKSPRASKKKRTMSGADEALISPTLMTWVVSAGVVVLVSVVGFGAGFVIGREVGRQESLSSLGSSNASAVADGGSCGRDVIRSGGGTLRRLRWGSGMGKSIVA
jgi:hypothetical protein